ncbi:MAG: hypothetical protein PHG82_02920 [Candidatus Gracilibacteria bacterium]|nr:hypothetical protein [Candidatus Gracilibacteria bacterium]
MNKVTKPETGYYELEVKKGFDYINKNFNVIKRKLDIENMEILKIKNLVKEIILD